MQELCYLSALLAIKRGESPEAPLKLLSEAVDLHFQALKVESCNFWC